MFSSSFVLLSVHWTSFHFGTRDAREPKMNKIKKQSKYNATKIILNSVLCWFLVPSILSPFNNKPDIYFGCCRNIGWSFVFFLFFIFYLGCSLSLPTQSMINLMVLSVIIITWILWNRSDCPHIHDFVLRYILNKRRMELVIWLQARMSWVVFFSSSYVCCFLSYHLWKGTFPASKLINFSPSCRFNIFQ